MNKIDLIKEVYFSKMPDLKPCEWNDMLESDGFLIFLKSIETAMDIHLANHAGKFVEFVNKNYVKTLFHPEDKHHTSQIMITQAYFDSIKPPILFCQRESKHFEDDGAYADD